ncbi:ABC transporter ATP-binding protein [Xenorhabdus sp. 12]|uniref:ABC transporter ATP-binding protein n=1 Tax=Xenorhabdus santafensis TaxID=2582833 RepID=A0ABU4S948_9GAMM|nr:ABC transporter ATP-binding protein [Xenorhabdus sp. 12]MDX7987337.1 ABC transporter ATP-binding protein [Xenorhabdus sp. 12]
MLEVTDVYYNNGNLNVINSLSFALKDGEFLAITGENGSGKSILLNILSTVLKPSSGQIFFRGKDVYSDLFWYRRQIGISFGAPSGFYPRLNAIDNLVLFSFLKGNKLTAKEAKKLALDTGLKEPDIDKPYANYSLGMRQRLHLARACQLYYPLWILDEPTNGLDSEGIAFLSSKIKAHCANNGMVICVSHNKDFIANHRHQEIKLLKHGINNQ